MGRKKHIETPEKLWELFEEFVKHENDNPWTSQEWVGKDGNEVTKKLQVPILWEAFEVWLGDLEIMGRLKDYKSNREGRYEEFVPVITRMQSFIFQQNLKGASVGKFNANIIARKLGLMEKAQIDLNGEVAFKITGMEIK